MGGQLFVGPGQVRVAEDFSGARRAALQQEGGGGILVLPQFPFAIHPVAREDLRHREALLGITNGGRQHIGKALSPEPFQEFCPPIHRPGTVTEWIPL